MTVQLSRNADPLLKKVAGKRHATDADHEEPDTKRRRSPIAQKSRSSKDTSTESVLSEDVIRVPQPRASKPGPAVTIASLDEDDLKEPPKKPVRKQPDTRVRSESPAKKGSGKKAKRGSDDNKENAMTAPPRSSASSQETAFQFAPEYSSQRSSKSAGKVTYASKNKLSNFHHQNGKNSRNKPSIRVPQNHRTLQKKANNTEAEGSDDSADYSMDSTVESVHTRELDPELRPRVVKKRPSKETKNSQVIPMNDEELEAVLGITEKDKKVTKKEMQRTILRDQLGDWLQDQAPGSSQPDSDVPKEALDNLDDYIEQLPREDEEGSRCAICKASVEKSEYWSFWNRESNTVKNQNRFCRIHRTNSAREDYKNEGYPDIDWNLLPSRIRKHRMELYKILNNDRPSGYRDRYEPIALTGKAAAVPSRRKDLPSHVQEELESYALDDQSTYPGYYGPHGRRIITENVMKVLKNEIKNCADAVVQGSGPATFVQAVLVPEAAILLIMEDCRVDRDGAEEIRERTYDMGMLLHEEIDDQVEVHEQSDDENEYGGR